MGDYSANIPADDVVQKFDHDLENLANFLGVPAETNQIEMTLPYRLRFDALYYRARLISLEEGIKTIESLRKIANASQHTLLLVEGIQRMTIHEAKEHLPKLSLVIEICETKNLKRLEAEIRLIQICYHNVLKEVGTLSGLDIEASFRRTLDLCQRYPDTAGLLLSTWSAMRDVVSGIRRYSNMYTQNARDIWWTWPRHKIGHLQHCRYGHPYSSLVWTDCPECGREVPKKVPVSPNTFLKEKEFVEAMKSPITFDANAYSSRHRAT